MKTIFSKIKYCFLLTAFLLLCLYPMKIEAAIRTAGDFECDDSGGSWACFGRPGGTVEFQVSAHDPDSQVYFWLYWDDGSPRERWPVAGYVNSDELVSVSHNYGSSGQYNIFAEACDDQNLCAFGPSNIIEIFISKIVNFTKSVDKTTASVGEQINYTFSFDLVDAPARRLGMTDPIPANSSYVNGSASYNCPSGAGAGARVGSEIVWDMGDQAIGTCNFGMAVIAQGGVILDSAEAFARNADTVPSNIVATSVAEAWTQTEWGDVHSDGVITNSDQAGGEDSATYVVSANGSISDFHSEQGASWIFEDYDNLQSVFTAIDIQGLIDGDYGERKNTDLADWLGSDDPLITKSLWRGDDPAKNVWYRGVDLNIANNNQDLYLERGGTIVVDGDLRISDDIYYDPNFNCASVPGGIDCRDALPAVGFVVKGDVVIDPHVVHIVGNFYVLGTFYTGDSNSDQLVIEGSVVANEFDLERKYSLNGDPAEIFRYDGRVLVNPPPGFSDPAAKLPGGSEINP